jgi:nucleotide-binding universal stress UspA family protein
MNETWIIGVDGSEDSRVALDWALSQARSRDVALVALSAWSVPVSASSVAGGPGVMVDWSEVETAVRRRLDGVVGAAASNGLRVETRVVEGGSAWSLIDASDDADLLVVGSRGLGGFKRLVLGSVSRQCATHAHSPVAVVPRGSSTEPVQRIVVGVDGSANSAAALRWAMRFAPASVPIDAVGACEISPWTDPSTTRERFPVEVERAERDFDALLDELDPDGRCGRKFHLHGARQALSEAAATADLVVLGARGHGRVGAALLGSVTTWMLHSTQRTIVVVPDEPPADSHDG